MLSMEPNKESPLGLSTSQAARALGVSLGTIRRWSDMGYLESYRTPGGQRRFSRDQIEEFIESLQRGSRPVQTGLGVRSHGRLALPGGATIQHRPVRRTSVRRSGLTGAGFADPALHAQLVVEVDGVGVPVVDALAAEELGEHLDVARVKLGAGDPPQFAERLK